MIWLLIREFFSEWFFFSLLFRRHRYCSLRSYRYGRCAQCTPAVFMDIHADTYCVYIFMIRIWIFVNIYFSTQPASKCDNEWSPPHTYHHLIRTDRIRTMFYIFYFQFFFVMNLHLMDWRDIETYLWCVHEKTTTFRCVGVNMMAALVSKWCVFRASWWWFISCVFFLFGVSFRCCCWYS